MFIFLFSTGTREGDYSGCPCLCLQRSHQIRPDQDEKESKVQDDKPLFPSITGKPSNSTVGLVN